MPSVREENRDTRRINHAFRVYRTEAFATKKCPPGMNVYRLGRKGKQRYVTAPSFIEACYRWVMFDLHLGPWNADDDEDAWRRDTYLDEEASHLARLVDGNGTMYPR